MAAFLCCLRRKVSSCLLQVNSTSCPGMLPIRIRLVSLSTPLDRMSSATPQHRPIALVYSENSWSFNGELAACTATYDGTLNGNMTISSGLSCIIGGTVTGKVTQNGGGLFADNATIEGGLQITGASTFSIEYTVINGNVQINNISAGPAQNQICGTDIKGRLQLNNNGAAVAIGTTSASCPGNEIGGRMQFNDNRAALQVSDDTAGGDLQCHSNSSITGSGDTADSLQGQCAAFQ